jgi:hypothetical protein
MLELGRTCTLSRPAPADILGTSVLQTIAADLPSFPLLVLAAQHTAEYTLVTRGSKQVFVQWAL